jgi:hypothetical protein
MKSKPRNDGFRERRYPKSALLSEPCPHSAKGDIGTLETGAGFDPLQKSEKAFAPGAHGIARQASGLN